MIVLNFSHPLNAEQCGQIEKLAECSISGVQSIAVQIKQDEPLEQQVAHIVETVGLTAEEWQTQPLLINPPGYAPAAFVLLAELHGRMGHFPTCVRLRPVQGAVTTFEVAELLNLQAVRDRERTHRHPAVKTVKVDLAKVIRASVRNRSSIGS